MTNYDYKCPKCHSVTEINHPMLDNSDKWCAECGEKLYKIMSGGSGVIYKGKTGCRFNNQENSWGWSKKRPNPVEGHRVTAEERRSIEDKVIGEYSKRLKNNSKLNKAISKVMKSDFNKQEGK